MRVFVTGATGFIGSAVVKELLAHGHQVVGLSRSEEKAKALAESGAEVLMGTLDDLDLLKSAAAKADAVAHLGFNHDFSRFEENCAQDRKAILAMGEAIEGTQKPLVVTSGLALLRSADGGPATEADKPSPGFPRLSESTAEELAARGIRATSIRLPPSTHGAGDHGFVPILIGIAREKGVAVYSGDGSNRWAGTHRTDAAKVYRLALERGAEGGPFHAVAEGSIPFKAIAETIGKGLGLPVKSKTPEEAAAHFGWFAMFAGMDVPASAARTKALLGWQPTGLGLLEDMEKSGYFLQS